MGIIWELIKLLGEGESTKEKDKRIKDKLFKQEAKNLGLTKKEIEECKKSGITPEEWAEENDENYDS